MSNEHPEWRKFELLVAQIEEYLSDGDAVITCPDKIRDIENGEMREVDASIRYKIGSVNLLIIFECRYQSRRQGTLWIEQLESKKRALSAARCVAISSTGFSIPATRKAERLGVELRTLKSISKDTVERWISGKSWFYQRRINNISLTFEKAMKMQSTDPSKWMSYDDKLNRKLKDKIRNRTLVIYDVHTNEELSIGDYVNQYLNRAFGELDMGQTITDQIGKVLNISFAGETSHYVIIDKEKYGLGGFACKVVFLSYENFALSLKHTFEYSDPKTKILEGQVWEVRSKNDSHDFILKTSKME